MRELTKTEARRLAKLEGLVSAEEGERLALLASGVTEGVIVEVGSHRGKSTCYLAAGSKRGAGVPVYAVDLWGQHPSPHWSNPGHFAKFVEQTEPYADVVTAVQGDSAEVVKRWSQPIGLLFIDGVHTYVGAERDIREWSQFLIPGGFIAIDDATKPKVARAIKTHERGFTDWQQVGKLRTAVKRGV